ncbi:hypothetical protein [Xanthocytophaga flava]|uniref:hypothetical protein n=1 Tax=Xanthocytophaga flava TaxID=3048013 RepID=UPI0028D0A260|nr:hypothetical protein [Xanthocytophaga flavus]MDJ1471164.1 hypothetical protein [Xanthocytophaga flavus]
MKSLSFSIIPTLLLLITSCNQKQNYQYDTFTVDTTLSKQLVFRLMDNEYELTNPFDKDTIPRKTTSTVTIAVLKDSHDRMYTMDKLRCKASLKKDTLRITIGYADGFTGAGISIRAAGNTFTTLPYQFYDVITGEKEPIIHIEKQKLMLNKAVYQVGDSLYGHLYLRTIDTDCVKKYASGFFRTVVTKEE